MTLDLQQTYFAVSPNGQTAELSLQQLLSYSPRTLLYFYPKDNTPGCTVENKDFSCLKEQFTQAGITVIGVSRDSIESHQKFIDAQNLDIDLISDPDLQLHKALGAYGEKNNYGKIVEGVIRSTFLLDQNGDIIKSWINIRAKGHGERVLNELIS